MQCTLLVLNPMVQSIERKHEKIIRRIDKTLSGVPSTMSDYKNTINLVHLLNKKKEVKKNPKATRIIEVISSANHAQLLQFQCVRDHFKYKVYKNKAS